MRLSREQSRQQTRRRLQESALGIIARNGFAGAGIEQIVQAAGLTRGAFYANYRNKPELLIDMLKERQLREVRLWNDMFENAVDLDQCLDAVVAHCGDRAQMLDRTMLSIELQLEADRNEVFRPYFLDYLDAIYAEMRMLFTTILRRNGKACPGNLDAMIVIAYQFGLNLGSTVVLGSEIGRQAQPEAMMVAFIKNMIDTAPSINGTLVSQTI